MGLILKVFSVIAAVAYAAESIISPIPLGEDVHNPSAGISESAVQLFDLSPRGGRHPGEKKKTDEPLLGVLGASDEAPEESPNTEESDEAEEEEIATTFKDHITVSLVGDSMVDTLGKGFPELVSSLEAVYPDTTFTVINHGVGATNIEYGLERLTNSYTYLEEHRPSVISEQPDLVVVESFGYNPFPVAEGGLDQHWLTMGKMIEVLYREIPTTEVVIATTVAPNATVFGDGAPGVAFSPQGKQEHVDVIKSYLESTIRFAKSQKLPLADAYTPSLQSDGNGALAYINAGDHIHTSPAGRKLFADIVTDTIVRYALLE